MHARSAQAFGWALIAVLACCTAALAQTPEEKRDDTPAPNPSTSASAEAPPQAASDVVMLKNGGMARGIITEMDPSGNVSLMLPNGQTRTWPMTEVDYAGPYSRVPERTAPPAPPQAPTATTVSVGRARLRLTSPQPGLTYYAEGAPVTGAAALVDGYVRLCTAPCEVELPEGEYVFALARGGASPTRVSKPLMVKGTMRLEGTHWSNKASRTMGWVVFGLGLGVGTSLVTWGLLSDPDVVCEPGARTPNDCESDSTSKTMKIAIGGALELVGLTIGLPSALSRDEVKIKAVVASPQPQRGHPTALQPSESDRLPSLADALSGMSVVGTF